MGDLGNLIRRLRRFAERWPHEEPTAEMAREAADELERLEAEAVRLRDALRWCGGSPSFAPKGEAHVGWIRVVAPLLEAAEPGQCVHGIDDGEYCPDCNAEYKRARIENGLDEGRLR